MLCPLGSCEWMNYGRRRRLGGTVGVASSKTNVQAQMKARTVRQGYRHNFYYGVARRCFSILRCKGVVGGFALVHACFFSGFAFCGVACGACFLTHSLTQSLRKARSARAPEQARHEALHLCRCSLSGSKSVVQGTSRTGTAISTPGSFLRTTTTIIS